MLTFYAYRARGQRSGAEVAMPAASVPMLRDVLMTHVNVYLDRGDALGDLGVSEGELDRIEP